jgi:hypothetical protein
MASESCTGMGRIFFGITGAKPAQTGERVQEKQKRMADERARPLVNNKQKGLAGTGSVCPERPMRDSCLPHVACFEAVHEVHSQEWLCYWTN